MNLDASEAIFQDAVFQLLKMNGWLYFHPTPHRTGNSWRTDGAGFPDIVACHPTGGVLWIELKTMSGRLTPLQRIWGNVLLKNKQEYYVWRPNQIDLIAERLSKH